MAKEYEIAFKLGAELESTFRKSLNTAAGGVENLNKKLKGMDKSDSFDKPSKSASKFSNILKGGLATAAGAAAAAVAALGSAALGAMKYMDGFKDAMNQVQASTGASAETMKEIKGITKSLYNQNLGEDFNDLASAISTVRQVTQQAGEDLEKTTRNAIVFRDVFGEDITESIKAADTMMKNFGITSDQAYNLLAQGAQRGLNKSKELLDTANEYAPQFAALGFTANEMFDMFSAGLESGAFNLDKVGDAVKEFNIRATDGSKSTIEAFQALGFNADKMMRTIGGGGPAAKEAFSEVVKAIASVRDPVKQNEIGFALMGTMFEDLETDVIKAMGTVNSQFDMTKETMDAIASVKYDSIGKAFQGIGRKLQTGLLMPLGDKLLPYVQRFADWADSKLPAVQKWFSDVGRAVTGAFNTFTNSSYYSKIQSIFSGIAEYAGIVVDVFRTNWPFIQNVISNTVETAKSVISGLLNVLDGVIDFIVGVFKGDWKRAWQGIKDVVSGIFEGLEAVMKLPINNAIALANHLIRGINSLKIDVPDWVTKLTGIKEFGFNIPELPQFADGGIATRPSIFGEAGPEIAIPLDNRPRSRSLLETANRIMGRSEGQSQIIIEAPFSPVIQVQGGADAGGQVDRALDRGFAEWKKHLNRYEQQLRRLKFT